MSDKSSRKAQRKALLAKKEMEKQMLEHPEWCYCEEVLHKEADIDFEKDEPIGQTEPVDGFPRWDSKGFTQNIFRCKRCGKQYCIPMVFASSANGFVQASELMNELAKKELISKLIAAVNKVTQNGRIGTANYISIPVENLQRIADDLGISMEQAADVLREYFKPRLN